MDRRAKTSAMDRNSRVALTIRIMQPTAASPSSCLKPGRYRESTRLEVAGSSYTGTPPSMSLPSACRWRAFVCLSVECRRYRRSVTVSGLPPVDVTIKKRHREAERGGASADWNPLDQGPGMQDLHPFAVLAALERPRGAETTNSAPRCHSIGTQAVTTAAQWFGCHMM